IFFQRKKNVSKKNEHIFKEVREEWGDYLEPDSWINKEKFDTKDYDSDNLLDCYKKWEKNEISKGFLDAYRIAEKLLKEYKIPFLSEDEINEFMEDANSNKYYYRGLFFSAVINNLFKDKEINLNSDKIKLIGYNNKDKKIVVKGDCGYGIGQWMEDREIVVEGNCGDSIGHGMSGGKIKICGDKFNPKEQISYFAQKGEIYHKDELVWKDGELI
ncbi:MAG: hypothetical protein KAU95_00945, partial [Candidatus Aenigmarchaeota archaeon]|nr:hypothetical protein [Candidatus Aenigmarchaeota archaeon]